MPNAHTGNGRGTLTSQSGAPAPAATHGGDRLNQSLKQPYYRVVGREVELFEHCHQRHLPLLLKGPTGSGKSRFVEHMAARLGHELVTVSCHDETSAVDLLGRHLIVGGDTIWQDGPLTRAVRTGAILYLDELAEARPDVITAIHPLTDHRRSIYLDRTGETLIAPDSFMLVASFNPGYQRGLKELKPSTRQRFAGISFGYPTADLETEIVSGETGVDQSIAKNLVKLAAKIRGQSELALAETVSTRLLVDAARLIESGLPPRLSALAAIAEPLSDEPETLQALEDLIALFF